MTVVSSKVFKLSASGGSLDIEALRTQLRKITDGQLREFSNASKYMNHAANHRSRTESRLCTAAWRGTGRRGVHATRSPSASEVGVILHEDWVYLVALA